MTGPVEADADGPEPEDSDESRRIEPGTRVEVRSRLDARRWGKGFRVQTLNDDGYVLVRSSDGTTMPVTFPFDDVRPERKRNTWWY